MKLNELMYITTLVLNAFLLPSMFFVSQCFGNMGGVYVNTKVLLKEMLKAIQIHTDVSLHQPELTKNQYTAETLLTENTSRKQLGTVSV